MPLPTSSNSNEIAEAQTSQFRKQRGKLWREAAGVTTLSLMALLPHFHLPFTDADEGLIATGAERILRGQVPYRDFFSELGPASFYLHALIFRIGPLHLFSMRLTAWLLGGVLTGLLYLLARRILTAGWAVMAVAAFPLVCYPLAYRVSHHWWANLFLLLTVLALAGAARPGLELRRCLLAGALAGFTLLAMQSKGFWVILAGAAFLLLEPRFAAAPYQRGPLSRALAYLAGAATMLGLMAGYFALQGALGAWVDANLIFLFTNYQVYLDVPQASAIQTVLHIGRLALASPSVHFTFYFVGYLFFFFLAPLVAFGGGVQRLLEARRQPTSGSRFHLLLLLAAAGAFISETHSPDIIHLMWGSPLLLILFVDQCERIHQRAGYVRKSLQGVGALVLALILSAAVRKAVKSSWIDAPVETRRGTLYVAPEAADATRARIQAIERVVRRGGETFFYPYMADYYFLTATRNPTRYDVLLPDFHRPAQVEEAISSLKRARPEWVFGFDRIQLLTIRPHFPDDPPDAVRPHPVGRALGEAGSGYRMKEVVADMDVWARQP